MNQVKMKRVQKTKKKIVLENTGSCFWEQIKSLKKRECDLEFDWEGGIEEEGFNELLFNSKNKSKDKKWKKGANKKVELTEEEKKEQARLALLTMDEDDSKRHFNLDDLLLDKKQKRRKGKRDVDEEEKKQVDDFKINIEDPRFQAIFSDHKFNIDPSDQMFKKTKAMESILNEKIKRIQSDDMGNKKSEEKSNGLEDGAKTDGGVSLLVKSIKSKTEVLKRKKRKIINFRKKLKNNY